MSERLNPQQLLAVHHVEGPLLVLAGAGSGKTRIVTYRIAHLLELGVPSGEILAVTFTNKAAQEMRQRIERLSHVTILASTFHSLCARILRESIKELGYTADFHIFDEEDSEKVLKECLVSLEQKEDRAFLKKVRSGISHLKNNLLEAGEFLQEDPLLSKAFALYQSRLKEYNALDFDDLLFLSVRLFREFPAVLEKYQRRWRFILIDEYQDTNTAQDTLIKLLAAKHRNVFAVGDPDQSIYSWRGANIENILHFEKDYPGAKTVQLEQNYRSSQMILDAANALIRNNRNRYEKNLWSALGRGEKLGLFLCEGEREEANFVIERLRRHQESMGIPWNECAIFYRTNFQSRLFEDALLRERIPYVIVGGLSFYQRREIKDVLALLRLVVGGSDFVSFSRTINLPKRGIGATTCTKLRTFAQDNAWDIFTACAHIIERRVPFSLSQKQYAGLKEYVDMILSLRQRVASGLPMHEVIAAAIECSRYLEHLKEDPDTEEERRQNVKELISKAAEWEEEVEYASLPAFLEELSLKSSLEENTLSNDAVRLMTLHNGKGLEFRVVFLVGMEEDLFPHANARESEAALEEERRLCYVGMTRAKEYLYLSASKDRFLWGTHRSMRPSRFLKEIPQEYVQRLHHSFAFRESEENAFKEESDLPFAVHERVYHKDFGNGIVQKAYQTSLGLTYDVFFPHAKTTRTLVAKYAKLTSANASVSTQENGRGPL